MAESGQLRHNCRKHGLICINALLANSRAVMAATGLTPTHCHRHSIVLITPCWGQFNWTNPIRAQERSGLLSSAAVIIEADGRKIKNVAAESWFAYLRLADRFICAGRETSYGKSFSCRVSRSCSFPRANRAEWIFDYISKCNGEQWCNWGVEYSFSIMF